MVGICVDWWVGVDYDVDCCVDLVLLCVDCVGWWIFVGGLLDFLDGLLWIVGFEYCVG